MNQLFTNDNLLQLQGIQQMINWILSFFIFCWILSIIWVSKDIHARTNSIVLQCICILIITICTPIIGLPIYRTIRPLKYKSFYEDNTNNEQISKDI